MELKTEIILFLAGLWMLFTFIYGIMDNITIHNNDFVITRIDLTSCRIEEIPNSFTNKTFWIPLEEGYEIGDTLTLKLN